MSPSNLRLPVPASPRSGAEALARRVSAAGVRHVFVYPGTSELALCHAFEETPLVGVTNSLGDREAVWFAAGGNLLTPFSCSAVLHGARGLTNALGAICEARRNEIPVLCIVGMASRGSMRFLPPHGEPDLIKHAAGFAKAGYDCSEVAGFDAEAFVRTIDAALDSVWSRPYGPVLLGVPQDLLMTTFVPEAIESDRTPSRPSGIECVAESLSDALAMIRGATRPLLFVDDYIFRSGAEAEAQLRQLAAVLGAPVLQVAYRRGPMLFQRLSRRAIPTYLGEYDPRDSEHAALFQACDLLITIEDRNMYPRVVGELPRCAKLAITTNPDATRKNAYLTTGDALLCGDVPTLLAALVDRAWSRTRRPWMPGSASAAARSRPRSTHPAALGLVRALADGLGGRSSPVIVDDSQMLGGLIANHYDLLPDVRVFGSHAGFVGSGIATAVGLALSQPECSVVCTVGDQGFANGVQALALAGERRAPLLIVACNNGGSVSLRKQAAADGIDADHCCFTQNASFSYVGVARAFGCKGSSIVWPAAEADDPQLARASETLVEAMRAGAKSGGPYVLEVIAPSAPAFWSGVWNIQGFETVRSAESVPTLASHEADGAALPVRRLSS